MADVKKLDCDKPPCKGSDPVFEVAHLVKDDPIAQGFYKTMIPQFDELEKNLNEQMSVLDDFSKKLKDERDAKAKKIAQEYVPQPLKNEGQGHRKVMKRLAKLLYNSNFPERFPEKPEKKQDPGAVFAEALQDMQKELEKLRPDFVDGKSPLELSSTPQAEEEELDEDFISEDNGPVNFTPLSELDRVLLLSQSLAAYATRLPAGHRKRFYTRVQNDMLHWITTLFRIKDSLALYHDEPLEGALHVARMALASKYPEYLTKGYDCLYSRSPVIYISDSSPQELNQVLSRGLGLPETCIYRIPCKKESGQLQKMDSDAFESLVEEHVASTREPVILIAYASTPQLAAVDPLQKLKTVCKAKGIWLHIEGLNLASLVLMNVPTSVMPVRTSDSCTLNMASWFGFPGCPSVTLFRKESESIANDLNLLSAPHHLRLKCLPLWVALQAVGVDGLIHRVKTAIQMSYMVLESLSKITSIGIVNKKPKPEPNNKNKEITGLGDLIGKLLSTFLVFELATPVVVFRYGKPKDTPAGSPVEAAQYNSDMNKKSGSAEIERYYDNLNIWFVETAKRDCPHVYLETVEIDGLGKAIKFSPLEHAYYMGTTEEHVTEFLEFTNLQIDIMDATVNHRLSFVDLVEAQDNLKFIDLPGWAGIGAVQYIPADWREEMDKLPEKAQNDINSINLELVQKLKANDSAFSLGKAVDGLACVRFGLITQETDVEELLGLVYATGKEIEESSKLMEQMAELVRKGIEQANKDLEKETESKLLQEGILRQVPLVSSLMNWFSPAPKDSANLKGRTFNLVSGTIKSTEETYKNKMQILENIPSPPKVQEPLKSLLKRGNLSNDEGSMSLSIYNNEPSILDDPGIDASGISIQTSSAANSRRSSTNNEPSVNCTDSETVNHVKANEPQPSSIEK